MKAVRYIKASHSSVVILNVRDLSDASKKMYSLFASFNLASKAAVSLRALLIWSEKFPFWWRGSTEIPTSFPGNGNEVAELWLVITRVRNSQLSNNQSGATWSSVKLHHHCGVLQVEFKTKGGRIEHFCWDLRYLFVVNLISFDWSA